MVCNSARWRFASLSLALIAAFPAHGEEANQSDAGPQVALSAPTSEATTPGATGLRVKPQAQGETLLSLGRLYEQRLIVKAQVELANAHGQLVEKGAVATRVEESYAPTVKMVQGVGNSLFATFLYPNNMTMDAKEGDLISGGYKVESISVNQVVLSKDGQRIRLGFSASPPTPLPAIDNGYSGVPMPPRTAGGY